ncbi:MULTISPECIES: hypothetical protein [unclassified Lysobacter]|uniref:hypothetical protein n=1 Tax=unclassified Lysobacter TaxID=2635362 RepID=UPI001BEC5A81|nr:MULTISPECIES: hypothetical protein [unclassified Lysobacter]MBT2749003.1 hypothetical protein [Lysobacter sp. ISL-42]MBT2750336.1 hypothetical protein [Lysobacter sp. ISL-50]MBT2778434.1 hypothetical protein [Lysobacter sp. ISL-54]MBT2781050.1 hypothetical protein [Lysobacter sp. ISL-52]
MNEFLLSMLTNLLMGLPGMLLYVLGLSLCLMRKPSLGRASTYAALGFGLLLLSTLLSLGSQAWIMWSAQHEHASISSLSIRVAVLSIASTLLSLTGVGLLLAAILVRRPAQGG